MLKSEIAEVLDLQAQELGTNLGLLRDALPTLPAVKHFATIVSGVRRCGKSTLLQQWASISGKKIVCVLFDDLRLMSFTAQDFVLLGKIIGERNAEAVILDEVQDIEGWELFVNGLLLQGLQVFVTGSNAKMLSRELGTKLTGRHLDVHLNPFSFSEFVRYKQLEKTAASLETYLQTGGFPAYVESGNKQILAELFNDIIYRDIVVRYRIANATPIKQLAAYLLAHIGTRLSPSRLKDVIHVQSSKTVLDYFDHLVECCMISRLEQFSPSAKARLLAQKKVYACDVALAALFEHGKTVNVGHKLENIIFWHLKKKSKDLTYYCDSNQYECDFVVEAEDGSYSLVQVCYELTENNREREFRGLASAAKYFGLSKGVIVTFSQCDEAVYDNCAIKIIPAFDYL